MSTTKLPGIQETAGTILDDSTKPAEGMTGTKADLSSKVLSDMERRAKQLLTLNSKEATDWLNELGNSKAFTDTFAKGSHIKQ
ncbi:hypothetical protein BC827DRAFT_1268590 [Russula dissimulans]|nr:hypothetical protein BC827DRAFT_1268590 [Russula dissimulans]